MLRLPARSVDINTLRAYFPGGCAKLKPTGAFVVLDFWSDDDLNDDDWFEAPRLATLIPIRSQLLQGDLRAAYVAWLSAVQAGELDEDKHEPPVPAGLSEVPPPLASLIELLRLDRDLLAVAAESSEPASVSSKEIHAWIKTRPTAEKDRWLLRAVDRPDSATGTELVAAFREERSRGSRNALRTVAELRARAQRIRTGRDARVVSVRGRRRVTVASAGGSRARSARSRGRLQVRSTPKS